jgi:hypothetical protein
MKKAKHRREKKLDTTPSPRSVSRLLFFLRVSAVNQSVPAVAAGSCHQAVFAGWGLVMA